MVFSKSLAIWIFLIAFLLTVGVVVFTYFQGGIPHSVRSTSYSPARANYLSIQKA